MKRFHAVIGLVVVVTVLTEVVYWSVPSFEPWSAILLGARFANASLLAIWIALGGKGILWRIAAAFVVVAVVLQQLAPMIPRIPEVPSWLWPPPILTLIWLALTAMVQLIVVAVMLLFVRLLGLELVNRANDLPEPKTSDLQRMQFSLLSLFVLLTTAAIAMGSMCSVPWDDLWTTSAMFWRGYLIFGTTGVLITLSTMWFVLGTRRFMARYVVLLAVLMFSVAWMLFLTRSFSCLVAFAVPFFFGQFGVILGVQCLIRFTGFRMMWRRRLQL